MKCYKCQVDVNSDTTNCPLCQSRLEDTTQNNPIFPIVPTYYHKHKILYKILFLISLLGIITCSSINILINGEISWSLFIILGILCFWITLITTMKKSKYFMNKIFKELNLVILLAILWDYVTGWHLWSLDYVLPLTCISYTIIIVIMRIFFKYHLKDNIIYVILNCFIGFLPIIFLFFEITKQKIPSLISIFLSLLMIIILIAFNHKSLKEELERRLHI